jgi:hypothetical protein
VTQPLYPFGQTNYVWQGEVPLSALQPSEGAENSPQAVPGSALVWNGTSWVPTGTAAAQTTFFVDPSNVSGFASDSNTGLSAASPLLTARALQALVANPGAAWVVQQNTTIVFMSDQPNLLDPLDLEVSLSGHTAGGNIGASLFISGTLNQVAADVISAYTPRVRTLGVGTQESLVGTGITNFTPYNNFLCRVTFPNGLHAGNTFYSSNVVPAATFSGTLDTANYPNLEPLQVVIVLGGAVGTATFNWFVNGVQQNASPVLTASAVVLAGLNGATGITINFAAGTYVAAQTLTTYSDAWFWIDSVTALATAVITAPVTQALGVNFDVANGIGTVAPPWMVIAVGDALTIYQPTKINVTGIVSTQAGLVNANIIGNSVYLQNCWIPVDPAAFATKMALEGVICQQVRNDAQQVTEGVSPEGNANCLNNGGANVNGITFYAGSLARLGATQFGVQPQGPVGVTLDGDIILHGNVNVTGAFLTCGFVNFGPSARNISVRRADLYLVGTGIYGNQMLAQQANPPGSGPYIATTYAALWGAAGVGQLLVRDRGWARLSPMTGAQAITAVKSLLLNNATPLEIDGSAGGAGTQISSYQASTGLWTGALAVTPTELDSLLGSNSPATAALQNPQTGSGIGLNDNQAT